MLKHTESSVCINKPVITPNQYKSDAEGQAPTTLQPVSDRTGPTETQDTVRLGLCGPTNSVGIYSGSVQTGLPAVSICTITRKSQVSSDPVSQQPLHVARPRGCIVYKRHVWGTCCVMLM